MSTSSQRQTSTPRFSRLSPNGPHTPLRNQTLSIASPSTLRAEEDCIILELGSRFLRLGPAGNAAPQAVVEFGPEKQRRAGDLRRWAHDFDTAGLPRPCGIEWGKEYELWPLKIQDVDLGLVSDKIERAVREAFNTTLLIDSRPRRMLLAIPSLLPLPLFFTVLETLFSKFQPSSISLMSKPILTAVAAGLRSALVIDIGWAETTVSAIYEFREVKCRRSVRASKMLSQAVYKRISTLVSKSSGIDSPESSEIQLSFEECEEIVERMIWCRSMKRHQGRQEYDNLTATEGHMVETSSSIEEDEPDCLISLPLKSIKPPRTIEIPFSEFAKPCETALLASGILESDLDDEELPLHILVFRCLLDLPVDARGTCMARIVFVGGASHIPGLKTRVMQELSSLIETQGWNPVTGKAVKELINNSKLPKMPIRQTGPSKISHQDDSTLASKVSVSNMSPHVDPITEKLNRESRRNAHVVQSGSLRVITSLGAWTGGSLISQMKIQAVSVIDREQWAQYGISKLSRIGDSSSTSQRQSTGPGTLRSGIGDKLSWILGV